MDWALTRILELLQPAADHAALAAAAAAAGGKLASAPGSAADATGPAGPGGALGDMSVSEVAGLAARWLGPEARRALETDLTTYCR